MSNPDWKQVQAELAEVFERHGLQVAIGFKRTGYPTELLKLIGISLRSQDERVDLQNLGKVEAQGVRTVWDRSDFIPQELQDALADLPDGQRISKLVVEATQRAYTQGREDVYDALLSDDVYYHLGAKQTFEHALKEAVEFVKEQKAVESSIKEQQ